nr:TRAM domain-containing protein [Algoriphagus marinus]
MSLVLLPKKQHAKELINSAKHYCRVGDFVQAKITDATEFDLFATVEE